MAASDSNLALRSGELLRVACPVCAGDGARVLPFRYAFHDRFLYGTRCTRCSLVFIHPQPSRAEIADLYKEEYFTEHSDTCGAHGPAAYMEMAQESGAERAKAARRLDGRILKHAGDRGRYLEVGCGPGFFLAAMRELGWTAEGLEISEYAARYAMRELGLTVTQGAIERDRFPSASFKAIFLGDVLEHLPDPHESLCLLRDWLAPGGILVIAVPSTMNLVSAKLGMGLYKMRGTWKTLRIPPYHLFEYEPRSLRATLTVSGFTVLELRQSAVPLEKMGLRGSRVENAGKLSLQLVAHLTSRVFNDGGDRLTAVARKG